MYTPYKTHYKSGLDQLEFDLEETKETTPTLSPTAEEFFKKPPKDTSYASLLVASSVADKICYICLYKLTNFLLKVSKVPACRDCVNKYIYKDA